MSKLEKDIIYIIKNNHLVPVQPSICGAVYCSLNAIKSANQILAAIIAHLEKCPAPRAIEEAMKQEMIKSLKEEGK